MGIGISAIHRREMASSALMELTLRQGQRAHTISQFVNKQDTFRCYLL